MDIDKTTDEIGMPIDKRIKPLVAALNNILEIKTIASCQGHKGRGENFPWVDVDSNQNLSKLAKALAVWDTISKVKWILYPYATFWRLRPMEITNLNEIQKDAEELADYIIKNFSR